MALTRRTFMAAGIGALLLGGIATALTSKEAGFTDDYMDVAEMQARGALVVDIRTPEEWSDTGVIEGARLVTYADPQGFMAQIAPDLAPGQELVLVCRSGNRTRAAAGELASLIDNPITSVDGGMKRIIASGYQPVKIR